MSEQKNTCQGCYESCIGCPRSPSHHTAALVDLFNWPNIEPSTKRKKQRHTLQQKPQSRRSKTLEA